MDFGIDPFDPSGWDGGLVVFFLMFFLGMVVGYLWIACCFFLLGGGGQANIVRIQIFFSELIVDLLKWRC